MSKLSCRHLYDLCKATQKAKTPDCHDSRACVVSHDCYTSQPSPEPDQHRFKFQLCHLLAPWPRRTTSCVWAIMQRWWWNLLLQVVGEKISLDETHSTWPQELGIEWGSAYKSTGNPEASPSILQQLTKGMGCTRSPDLGLERWAPIKDAFSHIPRQVSLCTHLRPVRCSACPSYLQTKSHISNVLLPPLLFIFIENSASTVLTPLHIFLSSQ